MQLCIVSAYKAPRVKAEDPGDPTYGFFELTLDALYTDTAVTGSGRYMSPIVALDPNAPLGWATAIRTECVRIGNDNGFPSLVSANVKIPTVS